VHYQGTRTYVEVLKAGKPARQAVRVSTVGAALTKVVSGLTVGQRVVLADLNAAVPSSSSTLTGRGGFGGFGGFGPGAGFTSRANVGGQGENRTFVGP
jgi:trimeric autotransporter adhesin